MSWNHSQNGLTDSDYRWFIEEDNVVYLCGHHHTPEAKHNHDFVVSSVASYLCFYARVRFPLQLKGKAQPSQLDINSTRLPFFLQ